MISEMNKSVSFALYERLSSPFYGALIITWFLWNWKIPYLTFFVSESKIDKNKLDYIVNNLYDFNTLVTYPLISTAIILTLFPIITNGAFWLHIKFKKWRIDQKNKLEMKTLLTVEQSIQLREEILKSEERLESLLERKNQEIKALSIEVEELNKIDAPTETHPKETDNSDITATKAIVSKIVASNELKNTFDTAVEYIQGGYSNLISANSATPKAIAYLEANHLIINKGNGMYSLTDLGRDVLKHMLDESY